MVASFASENNLATIVGTKTPGNVLGAINAKVGGGYWLRLPVFGWYTPNGASVEGRGITPDRLVEADAESLSRGVDTQLHAAAEFTRVFSGAV
jgi:C-terminal processing protease CtpA/Prc